MRVKARYPRDNSRIQATAVDFSRARIGDEGREHGAEVERRREEEEWKEERVSRKPAGQCNFIHFLLARSGL